MIGTLNGEITVSRAYAATGRDLHIDTPLSNITIAYRPDGLIADLIMPNVPVDKETGTYYVWDKGDFLRVPRTERARGTAAKEVSFNVSSDTYVAKNYALAMGLPYEDLANADAALNLRASGAMFLVDQLSLAWEDRIATLLTTTTNVGSNVSLTNRWNDPVNATPVDDLIAGRNSIRSTTGKEPNLAIFSDFAWQRFRIHPDVISFIRGTGDNTGGGGVTEAQVAAAFGYDRILIGKGIKNTGNEGAPNAFTDIWSNACILLHVAKTPGLMVPTWGYTFRWAPPGLPGHLAVERYNVTDRKIEKIETHMYQDEKVVATELGYLIVNT